MRQSALAFAAAIDRMSAREKAAMAQHKYGLPETQIYAESWRLCPGMGRPPNLLAWFASAPAALQEVLRELGWPPAWRVVGVPVPSAEM